MAELSKLPEEMLVRLLSRMPPKSLMRFKCICNSWYALITNPKFVDKHLSVSKHNKLSSSTTIVLKRYVLRDITSDKKDMVVSLFNLSHDNIDDDDDHHLDSVMEDLHVPSSMRLKRRAKFFGIEGIELSCHCDGIICLTDFRENVVLCNPSIKEFKLLPVSSLLLSSPNCTADGGPAVAVGFGYDFQSKSYKVVRILKFGGYTNIDDRYIIRSPKAEVYSLITNSWKQIKTASLVKETVIVWPDDYKPQAADSTYCKGIIFWTAIEKEKETSAAYTDDEDKVYQITERIISFHTSDETFHVISFPDGCFFTRKAFGLWNESISLCSCDWREENSISIWVLDDIGGVEGSWTKYLTFNPTVEIPFPLTLVGNDDQFLLVAMDKCVVILYNFHTQVFKYLPINGVFLNNSQAAFYVSSIVSIRSREVIRLTW